MRNRRFKSIGFLILFALCAISLAGCGGSAVSTVTATQYSTRSSVTSNNTGTTTAMPTTTALMTTASTSQATPSPKITASHEISKGETAFTNGRAIVRFYDKATYYGMMDENGYLLWKGEIPSNGWNSSRLETAFIDDGFIVLYMDGPSWVWDHSYNINYGVLILDDEGKTIFDYREQQDNAKYWYMGYFNNTFLLLKMYSDFSTSDQFSFLEIGIDGKVQQQLKIDGKPKGEAIRDCGQGIIAGYKYYDNKHFWFYNMHSHTYTVKELNYIYAEDNENALIKYDGAFYYIPFHYLNGTQKLLGLLKGNTLTQYKTQYYIGGSQYFNGSFSGVNLGLINLYSPSHNATPPGVYSISGKQISTYPTNWNTTGGTVFSNSGYAFVFLQGADKKEYFAVVNSEGEIIVEPTLKENGNNESEQYKDALNQYTDKNKEVIRSEYHQYSNNGWEGWHYHKENDSQIYTIYEVSNLSELLEYNVSPKDNSSQSSTGGQEKNYTFIKGFSIPGTWKNTGSYTYGQAQSGAIIVFDGSRCNFFSPNDTYSFYVEGNHYRLDCTSPLGDTVSFTVKIVDENHIDIFNGQNIVELTRIVQ